MVFDFIVSIFVGITTTILAVLPSVPATPQGIVDGGQWIIDQVASVISVLNMLFTPALMATIVVVIIAMFSFEGIYHATMWVIRKIPVINIK
jgi:hypothetical protein